MEKDKPLRRSDRKIKRREPLLTEVLYDFTTPKQWSKTEKTQLLAALELFDEADIESISERVPTKSRQHIEYYIRSLKRKALVICNKVSMINELDKWTKFLNRDNKNTDVSKYDPLSIPIFFISLFESFPHPSVCDGVDFKAAYEFIFCIMAEIPPRPVNKKTMEFISASFNEIAVMLNENSDLQNYVKDKLKENISASDQSSKDYLNPLNFPEVIVPLAISDDD